jgi:DNA-cytosine methyltransferase
LPTSLYGYIENFDIDPLNDEIKHKFIQEITHNEIPKLRGVLAGFPCKSFSRMGQMSRVALKREEQRLLDDPKFGQLIFEALRIVSQGDAEFFVFENVQEFISGIYAHEEGSGRPLRIWDDLMYPKLMAEDGPLGGRFHISYKVLNSSSYSAQERKRVFIVGIRKDVAPEFKFKHMVYAEPDKSSYVLTFPNDCSHIPLEQAEPPYTLPMPNFYSSSDYVNSIPNPKYNITMKQRAFLIERKRQGVASTSRDDIPIGRYAFGHQVLPSSPIANTKSEHTYSKSELLSNTLIGKSTTYVKFLCPYSNQDVVRVITPRESARLMTFDSDRTARAPFPISDTSAYRACGYSIVTRLLEEVAVAVISHLDFHKS